MFKVVSEEVTYWAGSPYGDISAAGKKCYAAGKKCWKFPEHQIQMHQKMDIKTDTKINPSGVLRVIWGTGFFLPSPAL